MLLALLAACAGPITNAFLEEDRQFVDALPRREQLIVVVDAESSPQLNELQAGAQQLNATVSAFLDWVDTVSALPPTTRGEKSRGWGPHPVDAVPTWQWDAQIVRDAPGRYAWEFSLDTGDGPQPFFWGESLSGYDATESDGSFTYDASVFNTLGLWQGFEGPLNVTFDYINGHRVSAALPEASPPLTYDYEETDDEAWFWYAAELNLDENPADESVLVAGRWRLTGGGRSDTHYFGGDFSPNVGIQTQCWDDTGAIVYEGNAINGYPTESTGDAADCTYPEVVTAP